MLMSGLFNETVQVTKIFLVVFFYESRAGSTPSSECMVFSYSFCLPVVSSLWSRAVQRAQDVENNIEQYGICTAAYTGMNEEWNDAPGQVSCHM